MIDFLQRLFGLVTIEKLVERDNVAHAICNQFGRYQQPTPTRVVHAQCINAIGDIRLYTDDGKEYLVTVRET